MDPAAKSNQSRPSEAMKKGQSSVEYVNGDYDTELRTAENHPSRHSGEWRLILYEAAPWEHDLESRDSLSTTEEAVVRHKSAQDNGILTRQSESCPKEFDSNIQPNRRNSGPTDEDSVCIKSLATKKGILNSAHPSGGSASDTVNVRYDLRSKRPQNQRDRVSATESRVLPSSKNSPGLSTPLKLARSPPSAGSSVFSLTPTPGSSAFWEKPELPEFGDGNLATPITPPTPQDIENCRNDEESPITAKQRRETVRPRLRKTGPFEPHGGTIHEAKPIIFKILPGYLPESPQHDSPRKFGHPINFDFTTLVKLGKRKANERSLSSLQRPSLPNVQEIDHGKRETILTKIMSEEYFDQIFTSEMRQNIKSDPTKCISLTQRRARCRNSKRSGDLAKALELFEHLSADLLPRLAVDYLEDLTDLIRLVFCGQHHMEDRISKVNSWRRLYGMTEVDVRSRALGEHSAIGANPRSLRPKPISANSTTRSNFEPWCPNRSSHLTPEQALEKALTKPLTKRELKQGHIYAYWNGANFGLIKIGITGGPIAKRIEQWERQCGHKAVKLYSKDEAELAPHCHRLEAIIHAELKAHRRIEQNCPGCSHRHWEWFEVGLEHAEAVIDRWTKWIWSRPYEEIKIKVETEDDWVNQEDEGEWQLKDEHRRNIAALCQPLPFVERRAAPRNQQQQAARPRTTLLRRSQRLGGSLRSASAPI